ncbi:MAG: flippase-like domain-containing protein [Paludibacteraceae bacterium]|nr:flippase-like domain-containing protein [Paludibacteraceae bacterium]
MIITKKDAIQTVVSLALGIIVFLLVYRELNIKEMRELLKNAHWEYIAIPVVLSLLSCIARALRWNQLIEPIAQKPALKNTFCAVMYGYFINHLLPRAGELARCGVLKKYEGIPFTELLGTVITERAFDLIITFLITFLTIVLEFELFGDILSGITIWQSICNLLTNPLLWIFLAVLTLVLYLLRKKIMQSKLMNKFKRLGTGIWNGLKSFTKVKNKPLFIVYSIFIFLMYYLMLYFSFWLFDFTADLGAEAGLTTYVFGALGMVAPVQGGIGTYEFMTIQALGIYGIGATAAGAFAVLSHLIEIVVNCVVGFGCSLILPFINKQKKEE